ncbi:hypothetical protein DV738_g2303, partial [Chaetothyriales sp. CBS 135597]
MTIEISDRAAKRLRQITSAAPRRNTLVAAPSGPDSHLRVTVTSGGCHGFQYLMSLEGPSKIDEDEDTGKAIVVMDEPSLELLKGSTIDFTTELIGSQFKIVIHRLVFEEHLLHCMDRRVHRARDPGVYTGILVMNTATFAFCSSIYTAAIPSIAHTYGCSLTVATLGVTTFLLGFSSGPLVFAPLSEVWGRNIIFRLVLGLFVLFQIGCALAPNIALLIVFRFFAGFFGSPTVTNSGGSLTDIWPQENRSVPLALFSAASFLGPVIAPTVGGFICQYTSWRWIFWVVLILGGICYVAMAIFVPETYSPKLLGDKRRRMPGYSTLDHPPLTQILYSTLTRPCLMLFTEPILFLLSLYMAFLFGILYLDFTAYPVVYHQTRGWPAGIAGLSFLGICVGMAIATLFSPYINRIYAVYTKRLGGPCPEARLPHLIFISWLIPVSLFWFAWTASPPIHWMSGIAAGVPFGFGLILLFLGITSYLTDCYGPFGASALAANAVMRSLFGAVFPLFSLDLYHALGVPWGTSLLGFVTLVMTPLPWVFYRFGPRIRARSKYHLKFDENVSLEATPKNLQLSSLNQSKTAHAAFTLDASTFFLKYHFSLDAREARRNEPKAKRLADNREKETALERLEFELPAAGDDEADSAGECRLVFRLICKYGVVKTYRLYYESGQVLHASFDSLASTNYWTVASRTLRDVVEYFGPKTDQLDWFLHDGRVTFTSYTEKIQSGREILKQPMQTSVALEQKDFDQVSVHEGLHIGITVKDFRSIIAHAETMRVQVTARYSQGNRPMRIAYESSGLHAEFTLMTRASPEAGASPGTTRGSIPSAARNLSVQARAVSVASEGQRRLRPEDDDGDAHASRPVSQMGPPVARPPPVRKQAKSVAAFSRGESPPAPSASINPDSLFIPADDDDDHRWDEPNFDEDQDIVTWDHTSASTSLRRIQDTGSNPLPLDDSLANVSGFHEIEPTQRLSQVKGLYISPVINQLTAVAMFPPAKGDNLALSCHTDPVLAACSKASKCWQLHCWHLSSTATTDGIKPTICMECIQAAPTGKDLGLRRQVQGLATGGETFCIPKQDLIAIITPEKSKVSTCNDSKRRKSYLQPTWAPNSLLIHPLLAELTFPRGAPSIGFASVSDQYNMAHSAADAKNCRTNVHISLCSQVKGKSWSAGAGGSLLTESKFTLCSIPADIYNLPVNHKIRRFPAGRNVSNLGARHPKYSTIADEVRGRPESHILQMIAERWFGLKVQSQGSNPDLAVLNERCGIRVPRSITVVQDPTMSLRTVASFNKAYADGADKAPSPSPPHVVAWPTFTPQVAVKKAEEQEEDNDENSLSFFLEYASTDKNQGGRGLWSMRRFVDLLMGEVPRLRDDAMGYGPRGKGFIVHVDIPAEVEEAIRTRVVVSGTVNKENDPPAPKTSRLSISSPAALDRLVKPFKCPGSANARSKASGGQPPRKRRKVNYAEDAAAQTEDGSGGFSLDDNGDSVKLKDRFPVFKAKDKETVFRKAFTIPLVNKNAYDPARPAPSLGMRRGIPFINKPLHDPSGEFAIVLYDPTIDEPVDQAVLDEQARVKAEAAAEAAKKKLDVPLMHKSLAELLGIKKDVDGERPKVPVVIDPKLAKVLRPHQVEGVKFLYRCTTGMIEERAKGCIMADEMGLGKTLQCIALMWTLLKQSPMAGKGTIQKCVIACPASLVKNWANELVKWLGPNAINPFAVDGKATKEELTSQLKQWAIVSGRQVTRPVLIVSYESLRLNIDELKDVKIGLLLCDEGHRLKNADSNTYMALTGLNVERRVILSGTPIQNDLTEYFALLDFANPGYLGTRTDFRKKFELPILRGRDAAGSDQDREKGEVATKELGEAVNKFIIRRTNDILSKYLPIKYEHVVFCNLAPFQLDLYNHFIRSPDIKSLLKGKGSQPLKAIGILKKLCNHPDLLDLESDLPGSEKCWPEDYSPKGSRGRDRDVKCWWSGKFMVLERMLARIRQDTNDKIVLISNYTQTLDVLENLCRMRRYGCLRLDGTMNVNKRQKLVDKFNDPQGEEFVFLLSSKAGGCGINLIGANRLILFDPDWNPAADQQALARVWRDGQKKDCFVYRFMGTGTIEEKIFQRQSHKQALSSTVVDSNEEVERHFTLESLRELFQFKLDTKSDTHDTFKCKRCTAEGTQTIKAPAMLYGDTSTWNHFVNRGDGTGQLSKIQDLLLRQEASEGVVSAVFQYISH